MVQGCWARQRSIRTLTCRSEAKTDSRTIHQGHRRWRRTATSVSKLKRNCLKILPEARSVAHVELTTSRNAPCAGRPWSNAWTRAGSVPKCSSLGACIWHCTAACGGRCWQSIDILGPPCDSSCVGTCLSYAFWRRMDTGYECLRLVVVANVALVILMH